MVWEHNAKVQMKQDEMDRFNNGLVHQRLTAQVTYTVKKECDRLHLS